MNRSDDNMCVSGGGHHQAEHWSSARTTAGAVVCPMATADLIVRQMILLTTRPALISTITGKEHSVCVFV